MPERLQRFVRTEWVADDEPVPAWWTPEQGTAEFWRYMRARVTYDRARQAWKQEHGLTPPTSWPESAG